MKKELIGYVGVDSGQLMIVDPCYIDSHWVKREFQDMRKYYDDSGNILEYPADFTHFDEVIEKYGKTMNQMIGEGKFNRVESVTNSEFSYDGACRTTLSRYRSGELEIGATSAVVFSSGYGDGIYPVYAYKNKDGRIVKVRY